MATRSRFTMQEYENGLSFPLCCDNCGSTEDLMGYNDYHNTADAFVLCESCACEEDLETCTHLNL